MDPGSSPRPRLERVEILLAGDLPGDVRLTREALREDKLGNPLHVVADGPEALAFLRREGRFAEAARPQLVLLDLDLPGQSGCEVLAEMKRDPALRKIPVVMIAASRVEAEDSGAMRLGAAGVASKPVDLRQLAPILQRSVDLGITIVTVRAETPPPDVPIPGDE